MGRMAGLQGRAIDRVSGIFGESERCARMSGGIGVDLLANIDAVQRQPIPLTWLDRAKTIDLPGRCVLDDGNAAADGHKLEHNELSSVSR